MHFFSTFFLGLWLLLAPVLKAQNQAPSRVITTSPTMTELVFQLGFASHLIAVSDFSNYPEPAKYLPRVGTFFLPNLEKILSFAPDLVLIDASSTPAQMVHQLNHLKINYKSFSIHSVDDLFEKSQELSKNIFYQESSVFLNQEKKDFWKIKTQYQKPFTFLVTAWFSPLTLVGHSSFLSDLISHFGGKNLLSQEIRNPYPQVSIEWFIKNPPEFLFVLTDNDSQLTQAQKFVTQWWKNRRVKVIPLHSDYFGRATFTALRELPKILGELP